MMRAPSRWSWPRLTAWIVLPAMLWWCATLLDNLHLFILHQAYYLPLGTWMGEPFFTPDSEVMFFVMPAGRLLTALVYAGIAWVWMVAWRRWRRRRR